MAYLIALALSAVYIHVQYTPALRDRWLWLAAPILGLLMHVVWGVWCRRLEDGEVFLRAFWYWQVCTTLTCMLIPPVLYGIRLPIMIWLGIALVLVGGALVYFGDPTK